MFQATAKHTSKNRPTKKLTLTKKKKKKSSSATNETTNNQMNEQQHQKLLLFLSTSRDNNTHYYSYRRSYSYELFVYGMDGAALVQSEVMAVIYRDICMHTKHTIQLTSMHRNISFRART